MRFITFDNDIKLWKMYQDRRRVWVDALHSGKYHQASGRLVKPDYVPKGAEQTLSYCCLGVACDIYGEQFGWKLDYTQDQFIRPDRTDVAKLVMPEEMRAFFALSHADQKVLAHLNDKGVPFSTIAEIIELMAIVEE